MNVKSAHTPMSQDEIRKAAPSAFTEKPAESVSKHYSYISTKRVMDDMEKLGWEVVDAKEIKARKGKGFQKHLIVFGNPNLQIDGADGDTVFPRILLTNSHNGKNAFTFTAGLFRLICSNGLVISDTEFGSMKIRHMGYDFETLQTTINEMVEKLPLTVECMNRLKSKVMTWDEKEKFALEAIGLRVDTETNTVSVAELLEPTRKEDKGDSLWSVYNVVQEKLIHGMFNYSYASNFGRDKERKARRVKNFQQDMQINSDLYNLALQYA